VGLRSLNKAYAEESGESRVYADVVSRELRVSLGQLPEELRQSLRVLKIFGRKQESARLLEDLHPRLLTLGLAGELDNSGGRDTSTAAALGEAFLLRRPAVFDFLPPKTSVWKQFSSKTSSRKLAWAGGALAAAALILAGAFFIQNWELSKLRNRWASMELQVKELDETQQQIKRFRPWFDNSFKNLTAFKKLTEAFPIDGVVSAKNVDIRNSSQVVCSGVARDNQALFKMLDQLRASKDVSDVKMDQIRGKNPLQFSFNFNLGQGGASSER
jgi:Tfp pilus assembly protein PilN